MESDKKKFSCRSGCGAVFTAARNRCRHERVFHGNKVFECEYCPEAFNRCDALKLHQSRRHPDKTCVCERCGMITTSKKELKRHIGDVHGFKCELCDVSFRQKFNLTQHVKYEHGPQSTSVVCPDCNVKCVNPTALRSHRRIKHGHQLGMGATNVHRSAFHGFLKIYRYTPENIRKRRNTSDDDTVSKRSKNDDSSEKVEPDSALDADLIPNTTADASQFFSANKPRISRDLLVELSEDPVKFVLTLKCLLYKGNVDGERIEASPVFQSKPKRVINESEVPDAIDSAIQEILSLLETYQRNGSGWVFEAVVESDVHVGKYIPIAGSSFMQLPKKLRNKKAIVNVRNHDVYCFVYCLIAAFNPPNNHPERVSNYTKFVTFADDGPKVDGISFEGMNFPTTVADLDKFERNNIDITVNVYTYAEKKSEIIVYPLRISNVSRPKVVNLLYTSGENVSHFCLIKSLGRLVNKKSDTRFICPYCLHGYSRRVYLDDHLPYCMVHAAQRIEMPTKDNKYLAFKDGHKQLPIPYILVGDFECSIVPEDNGSDRHVPNSFCLYKIDFSGKRIFEPIVYVGDDTPKVFARKVNEEARWITDRQQKYRVFDPSKMTNDEKRYHRNTDKCHICKKTVEKRDKVHDHSHVDGKYRGPAHRVCNVRYSVPRKIPLFFHNLSRYDMKIVMDGIRHTAKRVDVIPETLENYISVDVDDVRYLDSLRFLGASLDNLVKKLKEKGEFRHTKAWLDSKGIGQHIDMLLRKNAYPYEWVKSIDVLKRDVFPPKSAFYSRVKDESITDEEYDHAAHVYETLNFKSFAEYHELYLVLDVLLLSDVLTDFRKRCISDDDLDPAHYFTMPNYNFDAMLKSTGVTLELMEDPTMYLCFENNIRGGISGISHRRATANNPYLDTYDPNEPHSYIMFEDMVNLYGACMMDDLPRDNFRWMSAGEIEKLDFLNVPDDGKMCYFLEVDLDYPSNLHEKHSDYPLAAEASIVADDSLSPYCTRMKEQLGLGKSTKKLIPNLNSKTKYLCHYRNLKFYVSHGMILTKIHRVVSCEQSKWLRPFIQLNTDKRKASDNSLDKDFYKAKNNTTYGKLEQNSRHFQNVSVVTDVKKVRKLVADPSYISHRVFYGDEDGDGSLAAIHRRQTKIKLNKPIYAGFAILELSKLRMYERYYGYLKPKYGENIRLCLTDTDSFLYHVQTEDVYADMLADSDLYDLSDYPKDHFLYDPSNKKVPGKMSDESNGLPIRGFVGLRSKMYAIKFDDETEKKRAKGVPRRLVQRDVRFNDYVKCLETERPTSVRYASIQSRNMRLYTTITRKTALSAYDDKRYILDDGVTSLAYGHFKISNGAD